MASRGESLISPEQLSELSALADGSLDPARRPEVESKIAASPELRVLYERERRVVELLVEARQSDRAPDRLRARLQAGQPNASVARRRRAQYGAVLAGVLAAAAITLVLALPAGTPGSPSLAEAAALAARGPSRPAPPADPRHGGVNLAQDVGGVYFPNWGYSRWRATGERIDRLGDRRAVTVYYQSRRWRIAYTIVGAPALAQPPAHVIELGGVELRVLVLGGHVVITWRRDGDTCVLSGGHVAPRVLEELASRPSAFSS